MTRFEFFQKILTQLEDLQARLNILRDTVKEEINFASSTAKEQNQNEH